MFPSSDPEYLEARSVKALVTAWVFSASFTKVWMPGAG